MAWTKANPTGKCPSIYEALSLGSASTVYSSAIENVNPILRNDRTNKYLTFAVAMTSTPASGNFETILYGAEKVGGTKFELKDAVVADFNTATTKAGTIDISAYPAPYYYVGIKSAGNDSAKTGKIYVYGDLD